jgi:2-furoyl-CoA dehydrogenase 2Fe-2S iron sulfur subunit
MSLDTFLREHPQPDEESIRDVLSGHLCRCTGYAPIVRAALEAAAELLDQNREKTDA